ncbi:MAG: ribbon-helix-helix protein, CopG family [Planctomycetota bacterium]|jgi:hypothetical protein
MAIASIKGTYSLDVETVRSLERLAALWAVSKSEALRRAIRMAAEQHAGIDAGTTKLLDQLQRSLGLDEDAAAHWNEQARDERRASARKREDRAG